MECCDVVVVGAGIMGCFITYNLCKLREKLNMTNNFRIIWLEQYTMNNDKGSSHGDSRIFRIGDPDLIKAKMATLSYKLFESLQNDTDIKLMHNINYLSFADKNNKLLLKEYNNNKLLNVKQELLSSENNRNMAINMNIKRNEIGILQNEGAAILFADKIRNHLLNMIENKYKLKLHQNCKVLRIDKNNLIVTYLQNNMEKHIKYSNKIILATGACTNNILSSSNLSIFPYTISNEQCCYFKPKKGYESLFDINNKNCNMPVFIRYREDEEKNDNILNKGYYYGIPMVSSFGVKVTVDEVDKSDGGEYLSLYDLINNKRSFGNNKDILKYSQLFVKQYLPNLDVNNYKILRCLYTIPKDYEFIIGDHYESNNIFLCFGFCGIGFKHSAFIGLFVAKQILNYHEMRDEIHLLSKFHPKRFRESQHSKL